MTKICCSYQRENNRIQVLYIHKFKYWFNSYIHSYIHLTCLKYLFQKPLDNYKNLKTYWNNKSRSWLLFDFVIQSSVNNFTDQNWYLYINVFWYIFKHIRYRKIFVYFKTINWAFIISFSWPRKLLKTLIFREVLQMHFFKDFWMWNCRYTEWIREQNCRIKI